MKPLCLLSFKTKEFNFYFCISSVCQWYWLLLLILQEKFALKDVDALYELVTNLLLS